MTQLLREAWEIRFSFPPLLDDEPLLEDVDDL